MCRPTNRAGPANGSARQQRAIRPRQPRLRALPAGDRQLVPKNRHLQLLRATRPPQQPHQREQVPNDEIHERPEQTAPWRGQAATPPRV
jgi:hypothetical protein